MKSKQIALSAILMCLSVSSIERSNASVFIDIAASAGGSIATYGGTAGFLTMALGGFAMGCEQDYTAMLVFILGGTGIIILDKSTQAVTLTELNDEKVKTLFGRYDDETNDMAKDFNADLPQINAYLSTAREDFKRGENLEILKADWIRYVGTLPYGTQIVLKKAGLL